MTKESEDSSNDYGFISKYIREDSNESEANIFKEKFKTKELGVTEVFGSIGEGESFLEGTNFNKRWGNENGFSSEDSDEKNKAIPNNDSEAKKEFLKHLEDDDSLTIDTCSNLNRNWRN